MSEAAPAGLSAPSGRGHSWLRWLSASAVAWMFVNAALAAPTRAGVSTFGDPPELAVVWLACAAGWASILVRARGRLALARRLCLALLVATLFGRSLVRTDAGLRLAVLGLTLWACAPWLRPRPGATATLLALALAVPALLLTEFPQGSVLWLQYALPAASLALLVPAVLPGRAAGRAAALFVLATGVACTAALTTYVTLARGLQLPLATVAVTRLHPLGLHPNLAVPFLVTALITGVALLAAAARGLRLALVAALAAVALALVAVQSRTGLLSAGFGLAVLVALGRPGRATVALHRLAVLGVGGLLLFPLSGLSSGSITHRSTSTVSKAVSFRSAMWELGRDTLRAAPWRGFGPGTAYVQGRFARPSRYDGLPKDDHPHNVLLAGGEALGWPGLLGLALLFAAGVRRPRSGGALARAATAAALAMWAADAVDMGGADATLYPSLAFLLLGLRQAAALPDDPGRGAPAHRAARRVAAIAGALLVLAGLLAFAGRSVKRAAIERLDALPSPPSALDAASVRDALSLSAALAPLDPDVPAQRSRLENLLHDGDAAAAALRRARTLFPGSAELAHQLALTLAASNPSDPQVDALLAESIALDPHGDGAWRRLRDRAQVRALVGDADGARDALVDAELLNPTAVAGLPLRGADASLALLPGGPNGAAVPIEGVLSRIAVRRAELAGEDPATELRLRMREVELLRALGQWDRADAAARDLFAGDASYLPRNLALTALARGAPDEAVTRFREAGLPDNIAPVTDLIEALSRSTRPDPPAFAEALQHAETLLARDVDLVFELGTVKRLLEAQRRWAESRGDALAATRFADALDFAAR